MNGDEHLQLLIRFGLREKEARLYLALAQRGRSTASEIARAARLDRVLSYRLLDQMRERGLVDITGERPRRFSAVPTDVVVDRVLHTRDVSRKEDLRLALRLKELLPPSPGAESPSDPRFKLLQGSDRVREIQAAMMQRAVRAVDLLIPLASLSSHLRELREELPPLVQHEVKVRLILGFDPEAANAARAAGRIESNLQLRIRLLPAPSGELLIVDGREVLLYLGGEQRRARIEPTAIWSNQPEFVLGQLTAFETVWTHAAREVPGLEPGTVIGSSWRDLITVAQKGNAATFSEDGSRTPGPRTNSRGGGVPRGGRNLPSRGPRRAPGKGNGLTSPARRR